MDGQIFISYRREESRWVARSLHSRLCRDFDQEKMFIDVDTVPLGDDFVKVIETTVPKCDILIAIIGPNWVSARDGEGVRKIDKAHDFMRLEIVTAFEAGIWVVPVLVDGATMPGPDDLPESLKPLARRNSLPITETSFVGDCNRLVSEIQRVLEQAAADKKIEEEIRLGKRARYYLREQREQEERGEGSANYG
jgi:hypothetical protein